MATVLDGLFRELEREEGQRAYNARLLSALGDGRDWEYSGTCVDLEKPVGRCSCGHPIRFEYWLRHKVNARQAVVGSECVNHFQEANPETFAHLTEAVEATKAQIAERERQARAAEQESRNGPLRAEWEACSAALNAVLESYGSRWKPDALYSAARNCPEQPPDYQRPSDYERWFGEQIGRIRQALTDLGQGHRLPPRAEVPERVKRYKGREFRQGPDGRWRSEGMEYLRTSYEGRSWSQDWEAAAFATWSEAQAAWKALAGNGEGRGEEYLRKMYRVAA